MHRNKRQASVSLVDHLVGAIAIYRQEVRPFTDKQLVSNLPAHTHICGASDAGTAQSGENPSG
jgi:hypothetical protein